MKKTKEHADFPNGFTSWIETHYEMVSIIERLRDLPEKKQPEIIVEINDTQGTGGFYELAEDWTNEFEIQNKGRAWDGEFFEEVERFAAMKLK